MSVAPQFSVYRSPSRSAARPLVVVVQSNEFQRMPTRIVAPLVPASAMPGIESVHTRIAPLLLVNRRPYRLNPLDLATLGVQRLDDCVSSFAEDDESKRRIQDALDVVLKPY